MRGAAGWVSLFLGLGLPGIVAVRHLARTDEIWTFLGFRRTAAAVRARLLDRVRTPGPPLGLARTVLLLLA